MLHFVDTNVLVYARDESEPQKQRKAAAWMAYLWRERTGRVSWQVLQEFYVTVTAKLRPGLEPAAARAEVSDLSSWNPIGVTNTLIEGAWSIQDRSSISFWDALVVAAAEARGCDRLLTEDLSDGQLVGRVQVVNPFVHQPPA